MFEAMKAPNVYVCIYVCVCVCACVCMWVCMYTCMCVYLGHMQVGESDFWPSWKEVCNTSLDVWMPPYTPQYIHGNIQICVCMIHVCIYACVLCIYACICWHACTTKNCSAQILFYRMKSHMRACVWSAHKFITAGVYKPGAMAFPVVLTLFFQLHTVRVQKCFRTKT